MSTIAPEELAAAMQRWGVLEARRRRRRCVGSTRFSKPTAQRWKVLIGAAARGSAARRRLHHSGARVERLRSRDVLFFLDAVAQYVDDQPELRGLPLDRDLPAIADEFGIAASDAVPAVRMALTGTASGPPLDLLFPLLGHERILMRVGAVNSRLLHGRGLVPIAFGPEESRSSRFGTQAARRAGIPGVGRGLG